MYGLVKLAARFPLPSEAISKLQIDDIDHFRGRMDRPLELLDKRFAKEDALYDSLPPDAQESYSLSRPERIDYQLNKIQNTYNRFGDPGEAAVKKSPMVGERIESPPPSKQPAPMAGKWDTRLELFRNWQQNKTN